MFYEVATRSNIPHSSVGTNKMLLGHGDKIDLNLFCRNDPGTIFQDFLSHCNMFFPWDNHGTRCDFSQAHGMGHVASHEHENVASCPPSFKIEVSNQYHLCNLSKSYKQ